MEANDPNAEEGCLGRDFREAKTNSVFFGIEGMISRRCIGACVNNSASVFFGIEGMISRRCVGAYVNISAPVKTQHMPSMLQSNPVGETQT